MNRTGDGEGDVLPLHWEVSILLDKDQKGVKEECTPNFIILLSIFCLIEPLTLSKYPAQSKRIKIKGKLMNSNPAHIE